MGRARWAIEAWLAVLRYLALRPITLLLFLVAKGLQRAHATRAAAWVYALRFPLFFYAFIQQLTYVCAMSKVKRWRLAAVAAALG